MALGLPKKFAVSRAARPLALAKGEGASGAEARPHTTEYRPSSPHLVNLIYDALGRMVEQQRGTAYQEIVYGPGGSKLALMNGQTLTKAFVPLPGGATAVYTSTGLAYYRHSDHLGSSRLASTASRTLYYSGAYAPFGESYAETGTTDRSFTGNNEDTVTGTADFMFREYSSNQQGRWISPDPAGIGAVDPADPQSWNRYAYVSNSPLNSVDPLGLVVFPGRDCLLDNNGYCTSWGRDGQIGGGGGWFGGLMGIGAMGIGRDVWASNYIISPETGRPIFVGYSRAGVFDSSTPVWMMGLGIPELKRREPGLVDINSSGSILRTTPATSRCTGDPQTISAFLLVPGGIFVTGHVPQLTPSGGVTLQGKVSQADTYHWNQVINVTANGSVLWKVYFTSKEERPLAVTTPVTCYIPGK